jgi:hypothetical protein
VGLVVAGCGSRQPEFTVWLNERVTDLSRAQVTAKIGSGEMDQDTLVWASGKWMAFREHPSAALLLAEAGPAAQRRARGVTGAPPGALTAGQGPQASRQAAGPTPAPVVPAAHGPGALLSAEAAGAPAAARPPGPFDHDKVFKSLAFQGPAEARALLGEPDAVVNGPDRITWLYRVSVRGHDGSMANLELQFIEGKIRAVVFWPPATMDDKIATARLNAGRKSSQVPRQRKHTVDEFHALVSGRSKAQILTDLGESTSQRIIHGQEVWQYDDAVEEKGRRWIFAIRFEGDRAAEVQGM